MNNQLLPVGTLLHNNAYRIERQLSSGGFGNTYLVTRMVFNETYALKEFFIRGVNTRVNETVTVSVDDNKGTFQSQRRKFTNEALRLHGVSHPNIVHVTDFFEENGTAYYVMDYIEGTSLKDYMLQRKRPMTEEEAMPILTQLLDALSYLHSLQPALLHLDIKPANLMLTKQGQLKIIDFGASKQISMEDDLHYTLSTMCYTPGFAPTEQMEQITELIGPWSDFYAVGATLYSLLAYKNPPSNTRVTFMKEKAFQFPEGISDRMRRLIVWMMNPDISQRPQRVEDITTFLGKEEEKPKEKPEPKPKEELPTPPKDEGTVVASDDNPLEDDETVRVNVAESSEPKPKVKDEPAIVVETPKPVEQMLQSTKENNPEMDEDPPSDPPKNRKWLYYAAGVFVLFFIIGMIARNNDSSMPNMETAEIPEDYLIVDVNSVDSIQAVIETGDTTAIGSLFTAVQAKIEELKNINPSEANEYLATIQVFLKENKDIIKAIVGDGAVATQINNIANMPYFMVPNEVDAAEEDFEGVPVWN